MKPKIKNLVNGIVSFFLTVCMLMSGGLATVGSYITEGISVYAANDFVWDLSDEGVLTITGTGEMPTYDWTKSSFTKSQVKTIVISEGVTSVIANAFSGCERLTEVQFPDSLKKIGDSAFSGCTNLSEINYPVSLEQVTPSGSTIGGVFQKCPIGSIIVPEGITKITSYLFEGASGLEEIILPDSVKSIDNRAFASSGLKKIKIGSKLENIGAYAFSGCKQLMEIQLPDCVKTIGYCAFSGCASLSKINYPRLLEKVTPSGSTIGGVFQKCPIGSINIPEGVTKIPCYLFDSADLIKFVVIPESVIDIEKNAFSNCRNTTVCVPDYKKYLINLVDEDANFVITSTVRKSEESDVLDVGKSLYSTNFSAVANSGSIAFVCEYEFKEDTFDTVQNKQLIIKIPKECELVEKTLKNNGEICKNYSQNNGKLSLPVKSEKGKITFSVKRIHYHPRVLSYAIMKYEKSGTDTYEIIDIVNEKFPSTSIEAGSVINSGKINVSGIAPVNTDIDIYANNKKIGTARSNRVGMYSAEVEIESPVEGMTYIIKAQSPDDENFYAQTKVSYSEDNPVVTDFSMRYNGINYDLKSKNQSFTNFTSGAVYKFNVGFDKPDCVDKVYIVSTRNNVSRYFEVPRDTDTNQFVAVGNLSEYLFGTLSVEYTKPRKEFDFEQAKKQYEEAVKMNMESPDTMPEVTEKINGGTTEYSFDLKDIVDLSEDESKIVKMNVKKFTSDQYTSSTDNDPDSHRTYSVADKDKKYTVDIDFSKAKSYVVAVNDIANNVVIQYEVDNFIDYLYSANRPNLADNISSVSVGFSYLDLFLKANDIEESYNEMLYRINCSNLSDDDKRLATKRAEYLKQDRENCPKKTMDIFCGNFLCRAMLLMVNLISGAI